MIYLTADAGANVYDGADGKTYPVYCPMALDAGATWMATRPNEPVRVPLTAEEEARITQACYDPNVTSLPFREYGDVHINALGLLVGENLGRRWSEELDGSALQPPPATPIIGNAPIPTRVP